MGKVVNIPVLKGSGIGTKVTNGIGLLPAASPVIVPFLQDSVKFVDSYSVNGITNPSQSVFYSATSSTNYWDWYVAAISPSTLSGLLSA